MQLLCVRIKAGQEDRTECLWSNFSPNVSRGHHFLSPSVKGQLRSIADAASLSFSALDARIDLGLDVVAKDFSVLVPYLLETNRRLSARSLGVNYEIGYQLTHHGPNTWLMGLVLGHDFTSTFEMDAEFYSQGAFHPSNYQPTLGLGARYKIHKPVILFLMSGRSVEPTRSNQSYFIDYFGLQFLLPPQSYDRE